VGRKTYAYDTPVLHVVLDLFDIVKVWDWGDVVHGDLWWICGGVVAENPAAF